MEFTPTTFIINPTAGGGKSEGRWEHIRKFAKDCAQHLTEKKGDAKSLARQAIQHGVERLVVVGGDGTLHEVVNGLMPEQEEGKKILPVIGLIMVGTGSDFIRNFNVEKNLEKMMDRALHGEGRAIDCGRILLTDAQRKERTSYFINQISCGCSSEVIEKVNRSSKSFGSLQYAMEGIKTYLSYAGCVLSIRGEGISFEGRVANVFVANGKWSGGGMCWAPHADPTDGYFELIVVEPVPKLVFLTQFWKIYTRSFDQLKWVHCFRAKWITIERKETVPLGIEADGEQPGYLPLKCEVMPAALKIAV